MEEPHVEQCRLAHFEANGTARVSKPRVETKHLSVQSNISRYKATISILDELLRLESIRPVAERVV